MKKNKTKKLNEMTNEEVIAFGENEIKEWKKIIKELKSWEK